MRRALQLTGLFVIGIDIEQTVETGTREECTSYVADYGSFEGRFGDMVEAAVHRFGFSRADVVLIAFDADCSTRSRMTSNMNGKCRAPSLSSIEPSRWLTVVAGGTET